MSGMNSESERPSYGRFHIAVVSLTFLLGCISPALECEPSPPPKPDLPKRGISAHRGGLLGCPVNTIGAFQRAISLGVHQIELDVRVTGDNVVVVAHDDQITAKNQTFQISESTIDQIQTLELPACTGENEKNEYIPTFQEALTMMPQNIWINVDIKNNNPHVATLVAETVAKTRRFDQVIFSARDKAAPAIRRFAEEAGRTSWIANMSREFFRCQYIDTTINSCAEFIQLVKVPYVSFIRGKPNQDTMNRLKKAGIRVNYSWLREEDEKELQHELKDLFDRGIDFVLVDHVDQALNAANNLGIPRHAPHWDHVSLLTNPPPFDCPTTQ